MMLTAGTSRGVENTDCTCIFTLTFQKWILGLNQQISPLSQLESEHLASKPFPTQLTHLAVPQTLQVILCDRYLRLARNT